MIVNFIALISIIALIIWFLCKDAKDNSTFDQLLDTQRRLNQATLEMKAMRALYAKDMQELIQLRAFRKRFDALMEARQNDETKDV